MSHISSVKTKISNLVLLKQTLKDLNIKYIENTDGTHLSVKGWNNEKENVSLLLKTGGPYEVGVFFNEKEKAYEFVADWWGVENYTEMNQDQYINKISQKYAYNTIMDKISSKGYDVVKEETDEKMNIRIVLRKWE